MIKFAGGDKETGRLFGFGLSEKNLKLLKTRGPILIDMGEMGLPNHLTLIFYGESEEAMQDKVADLLNNKTSVKEFVMRIVKTSLVGLALVIAQPLVIPFFGQILLDWGL